MMHSKMDMIRTSRLAMHLYYLESSGQVRLTCGEHIGKGLLTISKEDCATLRSSRNH